MAVPTQTQDKRPRGLLPDGSPSRGFVAVEVELDGSVSLPAAGFLLALRRRTWVDETDGVLTRRQVDSVAREHGISDIDLEAIVEELALAGWLNVTRDTVRDNGYLGWNPSKETRMGQRLAWRHRKSKQRGKQSRVTESVTEDVPVPVPLPVQPERPDVQGGTRGKASKDGSLAASTATDFSVLTPSEFPDVFTDTSRRAGGKDG